MTVEEFVKAGEGSRLPLCICEFREDELIRSIRCDWKLSCLPQEVLGVCLATYTASKEGITLEIDAA